MDYAKKNEPEGERKISEVSLIQNIGKQNKETHSTKTKPNPRTVTENLRLPAGAQWTIVEDWATRVWYGDISPCDSVTLNHI